MRLFFAPVPIVALAIAMSPARAETLRDFCPDRPGIGTPPCTMDRGHAAIELGLGDWTLTRSPGAREDDIATGQLLVRYGLTDSLEVQVGWTAYTHVRTRSGGAVAHRGGAGDVRIALRQNLHNPDGTGFSVALMPYASLPVGSRDIGAGDWGAGVLVPMTYALNPTLTLDLTAEADAAVDQDGSGRHLAYSAIVGLDAKLSSKIGATAELSLGQDEDPSGHATRALAGLSMDWSPNDRVQLDIGANFGLNRDSPDAELYVGIARRF